jgi:S1-C subfamily serine protease
MKYLVLAALLAAAGTTCAGPAQPVDSCVRVVAYVGEITDEPGSGTVVASGKGKSLVLTNRHVVTDSAGKVPMSEIEYDVFAKGNVYEARVVCWSKYDDLAILEVDADLPAAKVSDAPPKFGETVYEWGFPHGRRQKAQQGSYTRYDGIFQNDMVWGGYKAGVRMGPDGKKYLGGAVQAVAIPSAHGKSGSGVFNSSGGLVGVVWGGNDGSTDRVVGYAEVRDFLREKLPAAK